MKNFPALIILLAFLASPASHATSVLPLSLEQLATRASLIFYAEVIGNEVKKDEYSGQIVTLTHFKVLELIKGKIDHPEQQTHTIKQLGGTLPDSRQRLMVHGVPAFTVGQQYVVFLPQRSKLGFSSPLGLQQGRYSVIQQDSEKLISNGRAFAGASDAPGTSAKNSISLPLAVSAENPSRARLEDFIHTIKAYNTPAN